MKAVVLSGGRGARLAPYSKILPKPLMPIGDKSILEILISQMKSAGVDEVILAVGHKKDAIQAYFQNGRQFGVEIRYSVEDHPLGTTGPLSLIEGLTETFLVTNGDVLTNMSFKELINTHRQSRADATIAMHSYQLKVDLGVLKLKNGSHQIVDYIEKPTYDIPMSMGIYVFEPSVLAYIPANQYFDFPQLVKTLLKHNRVIHGFPFHGYWQDLGNPENYEQAIADFSRNPDFLMGGVK